MTLARFEIFLCVHLKVILTSAYWSTVTHWFKDLSQLIDICLAGLKHSFVLNLRWPEKCCSWKKDVIRVLQMCKRITWWFIPQCATRIQNASLPLYLCLWKGLPRHIKAQPKSTNLMLTVSVLTTMFPGWMSLWKTLRSRQCFTACTAWYMINRIFSSFSWWSRINACRLQQG